MSAGSALKRVVRPFGSAVASRRWANFADVGFAGIIVGAATVFAGAATVVHGRAQTAMVVVGFILTGIAVVLAVIARWIGSREPVGKTGRKPIIGWGNRRHSAEVDAKLAENFGAAAPPFPAPGDGSAAALPPPAGALPPHGPANTSGKDAGLCASEDAGAKGIRE
jgi:hypothetical protein